MVANTLGLNDSAYQYVIDALEADEMRAEREQRDEEDRQKVRVVIRLQSPLRFFVLMACSGGGFIHRISVLHAVCYGKTRFQMEMPIYVKSQVDVVVAGEAVFSSMGARRHRIGANVDSMWREGIFMCVCAEWELRCRRRVMAW